MDFNENNNESGNGEQQAPVIHWRVDKWFPDLGPEVQARLKAYHDELLKFNRTTSLISPKTLFVADALHFGDSILASKIIQKSNPKITEIYDFGSGSGFPGMVFGILFSQIKVKLIESDPKKCEFLKHIKGILNISNITIENRTIESLVDANIQYAMTRGFSSISKTLLVTRKLLAKGGCLFHLKGEEWGIEVGEMPSQLCSVWAPSLVGEYKLPVGTVKFAVVKTEKIS